VQSLPPTCGHPEYQEYNSAKWSLVYAQALKIRWIRNWMPRKRLDSVLAGILEI